MQGHLLICCLLDYFCWCVSSSEMTWLHYDNRKAKLPEASNQPPSPLSAPSSLFHPQWNISDYFFQRGEVITQELEKEEDALQKQAQEKGETLNRPFHPAPPFDCLWLCLYAKLGELCVDPRPAVRKSAGQTLFSTIAAHGTLLQQPTWHIVVWKVACRNLFVF